MADSHRGYRRDPDLITILEPSGTVTESKSAR
jgi:hypothetical protein